IGKTALAAKAVRALRSEGCFADGIAIVLCMGHRDVQEVLQLVADRFGTAERHAEVGASDQSPESLHRLFAGKDALVVLDNVEPDLDLEQVVTRLRAAGAVLLLTARQKMPGAGVPGDAWRELGLLSRQEALELFAQSSGRASFSQLGNDLPAA